MDVAKQSADTLLSGPVPSRQVGGRDGGAEAWARACVEPLLVQILVVVETIQMGTLKTQVEKGFMRTAFGHE